MTRLLPILWDTLGVAGLLSAAAWAAAAALVAAGVPRRGRFRAWCLSALAATLALGLATVASRQVRSIEVDRSAEVRAAEEAGARAAREKLRSRAAAVRFAEDTATDQADVAGVTATEEEGVYERAVAEELAKRSASRRAGQGPRAARRAAAAAAERPTEDEAAASPARTLPEAQLVVADRFDRANRAVAWGMFALAAGLCGMEYVRRYNSTLDAVWPLPLAGTVIDGLAAKEHVAELPTAGLPGFLRLAARKGESFIAFAPADPLPGCDALDRVAGGPAAWRLPKRMFPAAALAADPGLLETAFETAWFGRGGVVITGEEGAAAVLERVVAALANRRRTRAAARRTLDVAWALAAAPPPAVDELCRLAPRLNVRWIRAVPGGGADR